MSTEDAIRRVLNGTEVEYLVTKAQVETLASELLEALEKESRLLLEAQLEATRALVQQQAIANVLAIVNSDKVRLPVEEWSALAQAVIARLDLKTFIQESCPCAPGAPPHVHGDGGYAR